MKTYRVIAVLFTGMLVFASTQASGATVNWLTWNPNAVTTASAGVPGYLCVEKGNSSIPNGGETLTTYAADGSTPQVIMASTVQYRDSTANYRTFAGNGALCMTTTGVYGGTVYSYHGRMWSPTDTDSYQTGSLKNFQGIFNVGSVNYPHRYVLGDYSSLSEYTDGKSPQGQYAVGISNGSSVVTGVYGMCDVHNDIILASQGGTYPGSNDTAMGGPGLLISGWDRAGYAARGNTYVSDDLSSRVYLTRETSGLTTDGASCEYAMTRLTGDLRVAINNASIGVREGRKGMLAGQILGDSSYTLRINSTETYTEQGQTRTPNGTLILTGDNSGFTGGISILAGTVQVGFEGWINRDLTYEWHHGSQTENIGTISAGTYYDGATGKIGGGALTLASGATLDFYRTGMNEQKITTLTNNGTISSSNATTELHVQSGTSAGNLTGTLKLVKYGEGTLTLNGTNTSGETMDVRGGTLVLASGSSFAGDFEINGGTLTIQDDVTLTPGSALTFYSGSIGDNSTIKNTTLTLRNDYLTTPLHNLTLESGSILDLYSTKGSFSSLNATAGSVINGGNFGPGTLRVDSEYDSTISGELGPQLLIVKNGTGRLTLNGTADNTMAETLTVNEGYVDVNTNLVNTVTTVNGGSLTLMENGVLGEVIVDGGECILDSASVESVTVTSGTMKLNRDFTSTNLITLNGGTLDLNGHSLSASLYANAGQICNGTLLMDLPEFSLYTISSTLNDGDGTLSIVKRGAGQLSLNGATANTMSGTLTVNDGHVDVMTDLGAVNSTIDGCSLTLTTNGVLKGVTLQKGEFTIDGNGAADSLDVYTEGLATINGGTLAEVNLHGGSTSYTAGSVDKLTLDDTAALTIAMTGVNGLDLTDELILNSGALLTLNLTADLATDTEYRAITAPNMSGSALQNLSTLQSFKVYANNGTFTYLGANILKVLSWEDIPGTNALVFKMSGDKPMVPEPSTWVMLLLGLVGVYYARKNKR